jgi:hypothetical protein
MIVLEAAVKLSFTWLKVRVFGIGWPKEEITSRLAASGAGDQPGQLIEAQRIARLESSAARHLFFAPNCLVQSLALRAMLVRRGIDAELRIGARNKPGQFEAHAWVECAGMVLNDASGEHRHFTPFEDVPTAAETHAAAETRSQ